MVFMIKQCKQCNKDFNARFFYTTYCSNKCRLDYIKEHKKIVNCKNCNIKFEVSKNRHVFCCLKCGRKYRSKSNKGKGRHIKGYVMYGTNEYCCFCGSENKYCLEFHHLCRTSSNNGIVLCSNCHYTFHNKYGRRENMYARSTPESLLIDLYEEYQKQYSIENIKWLINKPTNNKYFLREHYYSINKEALS
jgi:hypothetical protein